MICDVDAGRRDRFIPWARRRSRTAGRSASWASFAHQRAQDRRGAQTAACARTQRPLALVLHELATNAAKYGALSVPDGRLEVKWRIEERPGEEPRLNVDWIESGGPPVTTPPDRKGFGSTLIDMTIQGQLAGTLDTRWLESGAQHRLSLSLKRLT